MSSYYLPEFDFNATNFLTLRGSATDPQTGYGTFSTRVRYVTVGPRAWRIKRFD
jgi:hypothetical protein